MLFNYLVAYDLKFGVEDGQRSDYMKSLKKVYAVYVFMCTFSLLKMTMVCKSLDIRFILQE